MDIMPAMSGLGTQDSPIPSGQSPSMPQLSTSQSESPHQDTVIAKQHEPCRWNSFSDATGHLSPGQLQQLQSPSPAAASQETISVDNNVQSYEAAGGLDSQLGESRQPESLDTTSSSPIANATSAWAETLEEHESDGNRVPFYPGKQPIYKR
jgi:hypothetical protein